MYTAQAIYLSADPRPVRVLYAADCEPNPDAIYAHMFANDVFVNVVDVRDYGPMAGPDFDCYHDEHSKRICEHFASKQAIVAEEPIAIPEPTSRARELLQSVRPILAAEWADRAIDTQWYVPSASGGVAHTVTLRPDTRFGGTYLHCDCLGWGPQRGKGKDCRHVTAVKNGEGVER